MELEKASVDIFTDDFTVTFSFRHMVGHVTDTVPLRCETLHFAQMHVIEVCHIAAAAESCQRTNDGDVSSLNALCMVAT